MRVGVRLRYEVQSALLRKSIDSKHYMQSIDTRYLIKLLFQALSEHVGDCRAVSHHRPKALRFVPARRDKLRAQEKEGIA